MYRTFLKAGLAMSVCAISMWSCSKKDVSTVSPTTDTTSAATKASYGLLDSIFLYAKQVYLWYDQLPDSTTFKPRGYFSSGSTDSARGMREIFALSRYAINSSTGKSYEYYDNDGDTSDTKYSYLERKDADLNGSSTGYKSYVTLLGWGNDLGIVPSSGDSYANVIYPRIVYDNGPADLKGVKRGQIIYKVNGTEVDLTTSTGISAINSAFNSSSITLTIADSYTDGRKYINTTSYYPIVTVTSSHDVTLTQSSYRSSPILKDTVLTVGSKKIGYFALLNFAEPDYVSAKLKTAFQAFNSAGISDIVVDLRYNGGGYVATSEQMANLIAPSSLNGKTMFVENYNQLVQSGGATMLKNIPQDDNPSKSYYDYTWTASSLTSQFSSSAGVGLNLSNVYFIVSDGTASASELLINNMKPYLNVKLIGTTLTSTSSNYPASTNTYGKPVGFFAIPISDYDIWIPEFESRNSSNTAVPYSGFTCDVTDWDDPTHDLGDPKEDALAQAINYITNGSFLATNTNIGTKSLVNNSFYSVNTFMSKDGGSSSLKAQSFKSFQPKINFPIQKGLIENFKTIKRLQ